MRQRPQPAVREVEYVDRAVGRGAGAELAVVEDPDVRHPRPARPPRFRMNAAASASSVRIRRSCAWRSDSGAGGSSSTGSPDLTSPSTSTRAYMRLSVGWTRMEMRLISPPRKFGRCVSHGMAGFTSSRRSRSPMRARVPAGSCDHSMPVVVRFSPTLPGSTRWPSSRSRSMASTAKRQTARNGPPCSVSSWCRSPSTPRTPTHARLTASFGSPPVETLTWRTRPITGEPKTRPSRSRHRR